MENVTKNATIDSNDGFVEVDSVIDEADAIMALVIEAPNESTARAQFQLLLDQAQGQISGVTGQAQWQSGRLDGTLHFPSAAQRLAFEMGLR
ncbi:DUF406 family protein [Ferrimonas balearica]|uniref:DUF406 family protein n=1 Tax=Ferrimonas balearica TaxID=44012 RepID=UPI001C973DAA|nr:DUF406 family protein [Ferrimonas balearica]MBY5979633.1 DUF406 family protein [Ferrimonas balearica]